MESQVSDMIQLMSSGGLSEFRMHMDTETEPVRFQSVGRKERREGERECGREEVRYGR